jgi:hypothetical protein
MIDILDDILGLSQPKNQPAAAATKPAPKARSQKAPAPKPVYAPIKDILRIATRAARHIGFECLRVEAKDGTVTLWGADGIDKTVFCKMVAVPNDPVDCAFAIGDFDALAPLLDDDALPMAYELVSTFKHVDPDDDESETIEVPESRPKFLRLAGYKHRLLNVAMAPKAALKQEPVWNTSVAVNPSQDFELFKKHAQRLRKTTEWVCIRIDSSLLSLVIGGKEDHSAEIAIATCEQCDGIPEHSWPIPVLLSVLRCAVATGASQMWIGVANSSWLMKMAFQSMSQFGEAMDFEFILPGKIVS